MDWTLADISNLCNVPNFEKVQDKPACNPKRHTEKENKAKVKSESVSVKERNIVAKTVASDLRKF